MKKKPKSSGVIEVQRESFPLPLVQQKDDDLSKFTASLHSLIKKQAVRVISGQPGDFNTELENVVRLIHSSGYNKGLAHMDRMHAAKENKMN